MVLFEAETTDKQNMSQIAQNWYSAVKSVTGDDNGITMHHKGWGSKGVYFVQNIYDYSMQNNKVWNYLYYFNFNLLLLHK